MNRNIAVVGCGYWGRNLVRNFAELGALHTICDADPKELEQLASGYPGVNTESEYRHVLQNEQIRGIVIATPAAVHYSMANEALLAGKDVFVEKPLALKVAEGKQLVELAEQKGKILMVGHLLEYHPAVVKLKQLVDSGELGKINYISSNRLNLGKFRTEENILWSFAPHDISIILLLLGGEMPQEISAHGGYYLHQDIADVTLTTLTFKNGVKAHIFVSWLHPYKEQKLVVVGDKKMAVFDDVSAKHKLLLYKHQIEWVDRMPVPHQQEATPVEFSMIEPLQLECEHFIDCLVSRHKPKTDGTSGLKVLQVLDACQRSLQGQGGSIPSGSENSLFVHPTSLVEKPSNIGDGTKIWHFSHIMPEVTIGSDCIIGQNVFIGRGVRIGNNVKIQNNVSVYEGVTLEDDVFCGPSCVFTNVINPRSHLSRRQEFKPGLVKKGATIGANATIICGNTIGRYAFIGAGAVVTRDVPDHALVYGNPGRIQGWVCECGVRLREEENNAQCPECGKIYQKQGGRIESKGGS